MIRGALLARGIIVQRHRVIDSLQRVDPVSLSDERSQSIEGSIQYQDLFMVRYIVLLLSSS